MRARMAGTVRESVQRRRRAALTYCPSAPVSPELEDILSLSGLDAAPPVSTPVASASEVLAA